VARLPRSLIRIFTAVSIAYVGFVGILYMAQGKLIYLASRAPEEAMLRKAATLRIEPWRDAGGELLGWRRPNPQAANRILVFHGNAGLALLRSHFIEALQGLDAGRTWEVLVFEYPGYGSRPGDPSEATIVAAAHSAVEELLISDSRPLFLFGESLGSGPACATASQFPDKVAGLALLVPYQSLADAAANQYPFVPVKLLLRDRFDNAEALKRYRGPVVFALAGKDEVVTFAGGQRLYDGYSGPKRLIVFPEVGHNGVDYSPEADWWGEISRFLRNQRR